MLSRLERCSRPFFGAAELVPSLTPIAVSGSRLRCVYRLRLPTPGPQAMCLSEQRALPQGSSMVAQYRAAAQHAPLSRAGGGRNCSAAHATSRRHTRVVRHARHARSPSGMWGRAPETAPHTYTPVTSAAQSYTKNAQTRCRWGPPTATHTNAHRTAYNATRRVALYYTHTHSSTPQQPPPSTCPN